MFRARVDKVSCCCCCGFFLGVELAGALRNGTCTVDRTMSGQCFVEIEIKPTPAVDEPSAELHDPHMYEFNVVGAESTVMDIDRVGIKLIVLVSIFGERMHRVASLDVDQLLLNTEAVDNFDALVFAAAAYVEECCTMPLEDVYSDLTDLCGEPFLDPARLVRDHGDATFVCAIVAEHGSIVASYAYAFLQTCLTCTPPLPDVIDRP